jgi:membrane protease YdiL (CAAX protease family)
MFGLELFSGAGGFALGLALCLGFGGVGTLAARAVPAPEERLGLRGFSPGLLLPIALLLPAVVLASEIDNLVRPLLPSVPASGGAQGAAPPADEVLRLAVLEYAIVMVLLRPLLEEFFFRGVVLQGAVVHLGAAGGVAYTALLSGLASGGLALGLGPDRAGSAAAQAAFLGVALGLLRLASGSLLAPILAATAMQGTVLLAAFWLEERVPIPGFNAPGDHTPAWILAGCAASVTLGIGLALRALRARRAPEGDPPRGAP